MDRPTVTTTHRCDRAPVCRFTDCAAQAGAIEYWLIDGGCVAFQPALEPEWDRNRAMGAFIAGHVWEGNPSLGEALAALIDDVLAHEERSERLSQAEALLRRIYDHARRVPLSDVIRLDIADYLNGQPAEPMADSAHAAHLKARIKQMTADLNTQAARVSKSDKLLAQAEALLRLAFARGMWGDENNGVRNDIGRFLAGKSAESECTDCASLNAGVALADACEDEWDVLEELRRFGRVLDIVDAPHGIDEKADAIEAAVAKVRELSEAQEGGES